MFLSLLTHCLGGTYKDDWFDTYADDDGDQKPKTTIDSTKPLVNVSVNDKYIVTEHALP